MEFQSTPEEILEKIKLYKIPPNATMRIIVDDRYVVATASKTKKFRGTKKSHFPFLSGKIWYDEDGPADISENVDHYLYDSENVHGG